MELFIISVSSVAAGCVSRLSGGPDVAATGGSGVALAHPASHTLTISKNHNPFIGNISFQTSIGIEIIFPISYKTVVLEMV
jgi:hypothetical protein